MSTVTDGINTAMAVLSAGVAVFTLIDQRRARSESRAWDRTPARQAPGAPTAAGEKVSRAPVRGRRGRSGKASAALVMGIWGLIVVLANRPGVQGGDHGDLVVGVLLSVAGAFIGAWAVVDIRLSPGLRGGWLAVAGIAGGVAGVVAALSSVH